MLLIHDSTNDAQRFPLDKLLGFILAERSGDVIWQVSAARGYGLEICSYEDSLESQTAISVGADELVRICGDPDQWFYDLRCTDETLQLSFGLIDSTALFVEGDERLCAEIASNFEKVSNSKMKA